MIAFYAMGGLGNQLFQYAAARALAFRNKCELVVDPYWFEHPHRNETPRTYELNKFSISVRLGTSREQYQWRRLRGRLGPVFGVLQRVQILRERGHEYTPAVLDVKIPAYMIGYWQSERYFESIRDLLEQELRPAERLCRDDLKVIQMIEESTSVSIHVRRGDYITNPSAYHYHGLCSLSYYNAAIAALRVRLSKPRFFVFSDDPEWAIANIQCDAPTIYVRHNGPSQAFRDLTLMAKCQHHIIANSSFSWWGAWLSRRPGIILAPKRWNMAGTNSPDLLPKHWEQL